MTAKATTSKSAAKSSRPRATSTAGKRPARAGAGGSGRARSAGGAARARAASTSPIPREALFIGLDAHKRQTEVCLLDAAGDIVGRDRIPSTHSAFKAMFDCGRSLNIVLEVGGTSYWMSRLLTELGHEVTVASARHVRAIADNRNKSDRYDAEILARMLRFEPEFLHPVTHRGEAAQLIRTALKLRDTTIQARTMMVNSVRGVLRSYGVPVLMCSPERFPAAVAECEMPGNLGASIALSVGQIVTLNATICSYTERIGEIAEASEVAQRLMEIPGVGPIVAVSFISVVDDPSRFSSSSDIGPWLGLVPSRDQSGDRDVRGRITREGDRYMRRMLIQAAHGVMNSKRPTALKTWGEALASARGKKRAICGVARKLGVLMHRLWVTGMKFRPMPEVLDSAE